MRLITRPAPCEQLLKNSALPRPRTMNDFAPIDPGMMPITPSAAHIAPLRVTSTFSPKWFFRATWVWWQLIASGAASNGLAHGAAP